MKLEEARDLIAMMHAATGAGRMTGEKQAFWESQLQHLNADIATQAVLLGIKTWKYFPSWADFGETFQVVVRRQQGNPPAEQPETVAATQLPFWVKRWAAARLLHGAFQRPRDERPFPEQSEHAPPGLERMPNDEWVTEAERITDAQAYAALAAVGAEG